MLRIVVTEEIKTPICKKCLSLNVRPLGFHEGTAFSGVSFYESTSTGTKKISESQAQRFVCDDCGCRMEFIKTKLNPRTNSRCLARPLLAVLEWVRSRYDHPDNINEDKKQTSEAR